MKKYYRILSAIWKILLVSLILWGCTEAPEEKYDSSLDGLPDEQSDSVRTVTMDGNIVTMKMYADHIDRYYDKKLTYIDSLFVQKYDKEGTLNSTLTCKKATINETSNVIVCEGNVVIKGENGILRTPKLTWNRNTDDVFAENGVVMTRGDDTLTGDKMKTDMQMSYVEIVNVSAEGKVKGETLEW